MADIDFPVNPSLNATYSKDGKTWIWDGSRWRTNNILSYSGGGTGYASYTTGDLLVGTGNSILKFPVGQNNFQYLRVDSVNSASGVTWISLPLAGSGQSGLVSTLSQTFAGDKTFSSAIIGNLSGTSTTSQNLNTVSATTGTGHYLLFSPVNGGSGVAVSSDPQLQFSPSTNVLTVDTLSGNLSGTAATATNFYGTLVGTASTSQNVSVNAAGTNSAHYLTFALQGAGSGIAISTSNSAGKLTYNPLSEQLSVTYITGTSFTATNLTGTLLSSSQTNITALGTITTGTWNATAISTAKGGTGQDFSATSGLIKLSSGTASNISNPNSASIGNSFLTADTNGNIVWYPLTPGLSSAITSINSQAGPSITLQTGNTGSDFTISATTNTINFNIPDASGLNRGLVTTGTQTFAGTKTFSSAISGNISGTATTAQNVNTVSSNTASDHYLVFSPYNGGSGVALSVDGSLTFVPTTNVLTTDVFNGNLSATGATISTILNAQGNVVLGDGTSDTLTVNARLGSHLNPSGDGSYDLGTTALKYRNGFISNLTGTGFTATNFYGNLTGTIQTASQTNITALGTITTGTWNATAISTAKGGTGQDFSATSGLIKFSSGTASNISNPNAASIGNSFLTADTNGNIVWFPLTTGLSSAITSINSQTGPSITLQTGSSGNNFAISQSANTITFDIPDASGLNRGLVTTGSQTFAGTKTFSSTISGNLSGSATTAQNVNTVSSDTDGDHYLVFSPANGGSGVALSSDSSLKYIPTTNILISDVFSGNLSATGATITTIFNAQGNVVLGDGTSDTLTINARLGSHLNPSSNGSYDLGTPALRYRNGFISNLTGTGFTATNFYGNLVGTATTSQNLNITKTTLNSIHYLTFSNASVGSGLALTTSEVGVGFTVNPALNTLAAGTFVGNISGTGATFARATFSNDTEATDTATGSVTFAGGIAVAKKVFSQSVETSGNATIQGNLQVYGGIIQLGNSATADTVGFISKIQSAFLPQANNTFDIGFNDGTNAWRNAAFAGHGTFANVYGTSSANLTGVQFSGGDVLIRSGKSIKIYETGDVYNTSIKSNASISTNYTYTLPVATPGSGGSILQSDTSGNMLWVKAASNKATYVLSFGAGFTPTTGLDSVSLAIPYANDGSTSLTYTIKRVEVRTETEPGASTLAFYFERHTTGNAIWTGTPITIKGAASANFSVAQNNYVSSFTTITSSSGNNGEVASGNYLRVNFASVGTAANVSISIMIQEN